jgi:hypothetical protein
MTAAKRVIWKIRVAKPYPEAHNHLLIGQVLDRDQACISMNCRAYHFGRNISAAKDILIGPLAVRIVPWVRIEIIHELPAGFHFENSRLKAAPNGQFLLTDGEVSCSVVSRQERRY